MKCLESMVITIISKPSRFVLTGFVQKNPEFSEYLRNIRGQTKFMVMIDDAAHFPSIAKAFGDSCDGETFVTSSKALQVTQYRSKL